MAVTHRRSLIRVRIPRRNLYIPIYNSQRAKRNITRQLFSANDNYALLNVHCEYLSVLFLERPFDVALCRAFCHILALIVELLALAKTDLKLNAAVLEIQADRNQRVARLLYDAEKAVDFLFVHKEPAHAHRVAVKDISLLVWRDVHSVDEDLALDNGTPAVLKVHSALTDRLYLGAEQLDARLIAFLNKIIVVRLFILRDCFQ